MGEAKPFEEESHTGRLRRSDRRILFAKDEVVVGAVFRNFDVDMVRIDEVCSFLRAGDGCEKPSDVSKGDGQYKDKQSKDGAYQSVVAICQKTLRLISDQLGNMGLSRSQSRMIRCRHLVDVNEVPWRLIAQ